MLGSFQININQIIYLHSYLFTRLLIPHQNKTNFKYAIIDQNSNIQLFFHLKLFFCYTKIQQLNEKHRNSYLYFSFFICFRKYLYFLFFKFKIPYLKLQILHLLNLDLLNFLRFILFNYCFHLNYFYINIILVFFLINNHYIF